MFRFALALSFLSAFALTASAGEDTSVVNSPAQTCASRTTILQHLNHKYSEAPVALGLAENGGVIELLTSGEGGTWTIIITMPNGTSCMIAAGENWEQSPRINVKGPGI